MKTKVLFLVILLTIFGTSLQDGFNFYKALNRTPVTRVERVYRDGLSSRYKVPLTKKLFYNGIDDRETMAKQNEDYVALLLNLYPELRVNYPLKEKQEERCVELRNILPSLE